MEIDFNGMNKGMYTFFKKLKVGAFFFVKDKV